MKLYFKFMALLFVLLFACSSHVKSSHFKSIDESSEANVNTNHIAIKKKLSKVDLNSTLVVFRENNKSISSHITVFIDSFYLIDINQKDIIFADIPEGPHFIILQIVDGSSGIKPDLYIDSIYINKSDTIGISIKSIKYESIEEVVVKQVIGNQNLIERLTNNYNNLTEDCYYKNRKMMRSWYKEIIKAFHNGTQYIHNDRKKTKWNEYPTMPPSLH